MGFCDLLISHNKRVVGSVGGLFWLNRTDSGLVGLFGRDRSDPAVHAKHYTSCILMQILIARFFLSTPVF